MKKLIFVGLALTALTSYASAADLSARRPYTKAPAPIAVAYNWSGFYAGVHGGYSWSDELSFGTFGSTFKTSTSDLKGGFGGGQIGYNWQFAPSWVLGFEAEAAGADINYSQLTVAPPSKIRAFGTAAGRLGYAFDNVLLYGKGGFAWADNRVDAIILSESKTHTGWAAGAGVEYAFASAWSAKVEYLYLDLGHESYFTNFVPGGLEYGAKIHTVKAGLNYHFNWGGPVVAKY